MDFERIARLAEGVPFMGREQGRQVYDHIVRSGARQILELGTAHGASAAYMAAALDSLGSGRVTTVDRQVPDPSPAAVLERVGLTRWVSLVQVQDSSYTWWLKKQVKQQIARHGWCRPLYDFCYLDGAHDWQTDGLAAVLVERLLKPGGWLLIDDLGWTFAVDGPEWIRPEYSAEEAQEPHMRAVFDIVVGQHPSFTAFTDDGWWGWAQKGTVRTRLRRSVRDRSIPVRRRLSRILP